MMMMMILQNNSESIIDYDKVKELKMSHWH